MPECTGDAICHTHTGKSDWSFRSVGSSG